MGTGIQWTDETWNPVTGCDRVSPGCAHCYALDLAARLKAMGNRRYQVDGDPKTSGPGFGVTLHEDLLNLPLRWKRQRRIFVNSMSDLFHDDVPGDFIARVFNVMGEAKQHTFQVLTKRPERMQAFVTSYYEALAKFRVGGEPYPNVWLGTSVENQHWAEVRIPYLVETPAAVLFVSCEPLLGPVDLDRVWPGTAHSTDFINQIDWVITGGESGPRHRPMDPDWARGLRDQCSAAGVAYFHKQNGGRTPKAGGDELDGVRYQEMPA